MTNFTMVSNDIFNLDLSTGAFKLYTALLSYCYNDSNSCFPSQETLSAKIGKSVRTVQRYLKELSDKGLIFIKRRGSTSNLYTLLRKTASHTKSIAQKISNKMHREKSTQNSFNETGTERKYDFKKLESLLLGEDKNLTYSDCLIEK